MEENEGEDEGKNEEDRKSNLAIAMVAHRL